MPGVERATVTYQKGKGLKKCVGDLFTAATQQELAVIEKSEFDLEAGTFHHFRNKTSVESRYWLPTELVKLLPVEFESRP